MSMEAITSPPTCPVCGEARRNYIGSCGLCWECFIYQLLPRNYERRECYERGNATKCPSTGIDWLDKRGHQCRDLLMSNKRPR